MKISNPISMHTIDMMEIHNNPASATNGPSFAHFLTDTNDHLLAADSALQALASGQSTSLHQTMLSLEEAKISFQFLEQIRNRLMSAWQDILKEQI